MTCKNLGFNADKPIQYKKLQIKMDNIYKNQDPSLFRNVKAAALPDFENVDTREEILAKAAVKDSTEQINTSTKRLKSRKKSKNGPKSYEDLDQTLNDGGDSYDPTVTDDVSNKPPVPKKNKLNNVPQLIDNKRKSLQKSCCSKGRDSN